MLIVYYYS